MQFIALLLILLLFDNSSPVNLETNATSTSSVITSTYSFSITQQLYKNLPYSHLRGLIDNQIIHSDATLKNYGQLYFKNISSTCTPTFDDTECDQWEILANDPDWGIPLTFTTTNQIVSALENDKTSKLKIDLFRVTSN